MEHDRENTEPVAVDDVRAAALEFARGLVEAFGLQASTSSAVDGTEIEVRIDADGKNREVFATGIRNSVGMDFATDKSLWFTDNQVDGMGDDKPPGELNHATKAGENFGFPWYGGGAIRTGKANSANSGERPSACMISCELRWYACGS